jgi:hypothetical protein
MKKATLNQGVDMITRAALVVCAATGIVRMFLERPTMVTTPARVPRSDARPGGQCWQTGHQ